MKVIPINENFEITLATSWEIAQEDEVNTIWEKRPEHLFNGRFFAVLNIGADGAQGCFLEYKYLYAQEQGLDLGIETLAVAGIIEWNGKVLAGKRSQTVTQYPGYWELVPAGGLERLDYKEQILQELKEETGLIEKKLKPYCLLHTPQSNLYDLYVKFEVEGGKFLCSSEHEELCWLEREELCQKECVPGIELVLENL